MSESHGLTQARRRDIPRLAELWAHAFPGERTVEERIRQLEAGGVYGGIEHAWYLERNGLIAGAIRGYPLHQYIHGTQLSMLGVAAVAVAPHARRGGVAGELCRAILRIGRDRGDLVSALYPFRPDFYYRLGWALTGVLQAWRFRVQSLPAHIDRPAVRLATGDDMPAVQACYTRAAQRSHGLIERSSRIWANHLGMPHRHVFMLEGGEGVRGYVMLTYGRSRVPEQRTLHVHELVADDDVAYHTLLSWIALQRDEWPEAEYHALPEERFDLVLTDPRPPRYRGSRNLWAPTARLLRGPMLRIIDVPGALHAREHWPQATPLELTLRVRDRELPENEGPWRLSFDGTHVRCSAARGMAADLELAAPELAQLFVGEASVTELVRLGRARCSVDAARVDELFRSERTLRLLDEF